MSTTPTLAQVLVIRSNPDQVMIGLVAQTVTAAERLALVESMVRAGRLDYVGALLADERERLTRLLRVLRRQGHR